MLGLIFTTKLTFFCSKSTLETLKLKYFRVSILDFEKVNARLIINTYKKRINLSRSLNKYLINLISVLEVKNPALINIVKLFRKVILDSSCYRCKV